MATRTHGGEEIDRSLNSTNFTEFTLEKKPTGKTILARIAIIIVCLAVFVLCTLKAWYMGAISLLLAVIAFWLLWPLTKIEWEYVTSSGDWIFTKIIGGKRRKEVLNVKIKDMDIIAPYTSEYSEKQVADKIYDFRESAKQTEDIYFATFDEGDKKAMILFKCTNKALKIFYSYNKENTVKVDYLRY